MPSPPLPSRLRPRARAAALGALLAACASSGGTGGRADALAPAGDPMPRVRVVYRQFYEGSVPLVMENLAGRDLVELRSRPLRPGEVPVSYVPDGVLRALLGEFEDHGLARHLRPRPADPEALGGVAELTLHYPGGRTRSFVRVRRRAGTPSGEWRDASETYLRSVETFRAVWNHHRPFAQASTGDAGTFGVRRAGYGDD